MQLVAWVRSYSVGMSKKTTQSLMKRYENGSVQNSNKWPIVFQSKIIHWKINIFELVSRFSNVHLFAYAVHIEYECILPVYSLAGLLWPVSNQKAPKNHPPDPVAFGI